jgi:alkanesulfonate monooxygenase SsuD/methylene tetrahydromethanopterin reductase-like flavin-dependent oxidoreductase (luciferase family)
MEETLQTIERAEALGYDSVWLRDRHLQPGISSPVAIMAAASQRTSRIELGTAVIPLGLENPFRLAEDLATVDILSGGRINPGVSVGTPMLYEHYKTALYPESHDTQDFSKERVLRLLRALRGEPVSDFEGTVGIEQFTNRVQPHAPGLADRVWYGGGLESARWAGEQGINYLTSSVVSTEGTESRDFATIQGEQIDAYRAHHPRPETARVSQGLVVIPTDSATDDQARRYREYAASRFERTTAPQGPRRMLFSPDYVGTSDELADRLFDHAGFQRADEVAFALPFTFDADDYAQIIGDIAEYLGPRLGWQPRM